MADSFNGFTELDTELFNALILIIDDMPIMRTMIGMCLQGAGYGNLSYAEDGIDGLEKLQKLKPDLIILDLNMPRMSGFEFCEKLRQDPDMQDLPILVQSASESPEERNEVFKAGATDFVSKPINQPELLARVHNHLQNRILIRSLSSFRSRMEAELIMAREMQEDLLPKPELLATIKEEAGLVIKHQYTASFELGGDLWGCWQISPEKTAIYILDITGHGVSSALNTFRMQATMVRFMGLSDNPAKFLSALNAEIVNAFPVGQFATMFYCIIDSENDTLEFAGAGAPKPFLISNGTLTTLDSSGVPVGIMSDVVYENISVPFGKEDVLFCYSDVLIEAILDTEEPLGEAGLSRLIESNYQTYGATGLLSSTLDSFLSALPGALPDDLTALSVAGSLCKKPSPLTSDVPVVIAVCDEDAVDGFDPSALSCDDFRVLVVDSFDAIWPQVQENSDAFQCLLFGPSSDAAQHAAMLAEFLSQHTSADIPVVSILRSCNEEISSNLLVSGMTSVHTVAEDLIDLRVMLAEVTQDFQHVTSLQNYPLKILETLDLQSGQIEFRTRTEAKEIVKAFSYALNGHSEIALGLLELLVNAVEHGCLEIGHKLKGTLIEKGTLTREIRRRRKTPEYKDRTVSIAWQTEADRLKIVITDPGKGFDTRNVGKLDETRLADKNGRGLVLAKNYFNSISFNDAGNIVTAYYSLSEKR